MHLTEPRRRQLLGVAYGLWCGDREVAEGYNHIL